MTPTDWKNTNTLQDPTLTHTLSFYCQLRTACFWYFGPKAAFGFWPWALFICHKQLTYTMSPEAISKVIAAEKKKGGLHTGRGGMPTMQTYRWPARCCSKWFPSVPSRSVTHMSIFPKEPLSRMLCSCMPLQWSKETGREQSTTSESLRKNFLNTVHIFVRLVTRRAMCCPDDEEKEEEEGDNGATEGPTCCSRVNVGIVCVEWVAHRPHAKLTVRCVSGLSRSWPLTRHHHPMGVCSGLLTQSSHPKKNIWAAHCSSSSSCTHNCATGVDLTNELSTKPSWVESMTILYSVN